MNGVEDYSGHLVELRMLLIQAEEAAARGLFKTAGFHARSARHRLDKICASFNALAEKSAPEEA